MIAQDLADMFIPAALIGLGLVVIEGEAKLRRARQVVVERCPCGKPASHLTAPEDSADWSCRVPFPTYEPGVPERPLSVGDETAVIQALRLHGCTCASGPVAGHLHRPGCPLGVHERIWRPVADELAQRRDAR